MPLPLIPFILKMLVLKIFKGAFVGFARYFLRIFRKQQVSNEGDPLTGLKHINQVVNVEWKKKDNLIFLIIMLSSALYGLQELLVWIWCKYAKWQRLIFFTFTPNTLEQPDNFVKRVHALSWLKITGEIFWWVLTASLIYWPKNKKNIQLVATEDEKWINIIRSRKTYALKINKATDLQYRDMTITINQDSSVEVKLDSGETAHFHVSH